MSYKCVKSKPSDVERVRVCENGRHAIECPNNRKINVVFANYGRLKGIHVCGGFLIIFQNTSCGKPDRSLEIIQNDCQGKQECVLEANNAKFGDPCWGTHKYLEVIKVAPSIPCLTIPHHEAFVGHL